MDIKAYIVPNVSIPVVVNGKTLPFEPFEYSIVTSSFWGVYETADPDEQAALEKLPSVEALNEEDREKVLQKKSGTTNRLNLIVSREPQPLPFSPQPAAAPAVAADPVAVIKSREERADEILATKVIKGKR